MNNLEINRQKAITLAKERLVKYQQKYFPASNIDSFGFTTENRSYMIYSKLDESDFHEIQFKDKYGNKLQGIICQVSIRTQLKRLKVGWKNYMNMLIIAFDESDVDTCFYEKSDASMPRVLKNKLKDMRKILKEQQKDINFSSITL